MSSMLFFDEPIKLVQNWWCQFFFRLTQPSPLSREPSVACLRWGKYWVGCRVFRAGCVSLLQMPVGRSFIKWSPNGVRLRIIDSSKEGAGWPLVSWQMPTAKQWAVPRFSGCNAAATHFSGISKGGCWCLNTLAPFLFQKKWKSLV